MGSKLQIRLQHYITSSVFVSHKIHQNQHMCLIMVVSREIEMLLIGPLFSLFDIVCVYVMCPQSWSNILKVSKNFKTNGLLSVVSIFL